MLVLFVVFFSQWLWVCKTTSASHLHHGLQRRVAELAVFVKQLGDGAASRMRKKWGVQISPEKLQKGTNVVASAVPVAVPRASNSRRESV